MMSDRVFTVFIVILIIAAIALVSSLIALEIVEPSVDDVLIGRQCGVRGFGWHEVNDSGVYCVNYTNEPEIVYLGEYDEVVSR